MDSMLETIRQTLMEALLNKELLKVNLRVLKEELESVNDLRTRTNDHKLSCLSLAADLQSKINKATELHKSEIQRLHIVTKSTQKLEQVHQRVRSVLQEKTVVMQETLAQMSILRDPSKQSGYEELRTIFPIDEPDHIKLQNWNLNDEDNSAMYPDKTNKLQKLDRLEMFSRRSPGFSAFLTNEDFTLDKLLATPPFRRRPQETAAKSQVGVNSLATGDTLTVPKEKYASPRVATGFSPSTSCDLRPNKKLFGMKPDLKENVSPKTPLRSPALSSDHKWKIKDFIVGQSCLVCSDLIYYPRKLVQCTKCMKYAHAVCKAASPSCLRDHEKTKCTKPRTPKSASKSYCVGKLKNLVSQTSPKVPELIVKLVSEIEARWNNETNLYSEYVPEKQLISIIKEKLKVKGQIKLLDIRVGVLCGCLLEFIRRLAEPLVPRNKLRPLSEIISKENDEMKCEKILKLIQELEQENRDTLVFIILHLQRAVLKNKNTVRDIAKLFGPCILGCSKAHTENIPIGTERINKIMAELLLLPTVDADIVLPTMGPLAKPVSSAKSKFRFFNTPK